MKISSPLLSSDGHLLSDGASIILRWREHFNTLLSRLLVDPPLSLISEASEAAVDFSMPIDLPSVTETYKAILRQRPGKPVASAVYIQTMSAMLIEKKPCTT